MVGVLAGVLVEVVLGVLRGVMALLGPHDSEVGNEDIAVASHSPSGVATQAVVCVPTS